MHFRMRNITRAQHLRQAGIVMSQEPNQVSRFGAKDALHLGSSQPGQPAISSTFGRWLSLPSMIWARLLVLFLSLVSIKLALLVCLRKHLFEIHWRVEPVETNWGDQLAFFVFVCLGVLSLFRFGRHCQ